jgi:hypothetical protein
MRLLFHNEKPSLLLFCSDLLKRDRVEYFFWLNDIFYSDLPFRPKTDLSREKEITEKIINRIN